MKRPLELLIVPLPAGGVTVPLSAPAIAVFITDPEDGGAAVRPERLVSLYGLTHAEATLGSMLVGGATVESAADQLGISVLTARTQIKSILRKTDTHRQTDFIRLVMGGAHLAG